MLEDVRRGVRGFVEAVSGALTPSRARDLARSMTQGQGVEQINRVAQELLEWSQRSREWISETVQREVKRQLSGAGIATREDLDALRKRVRELEKSQGKPSPAKAKAKAKASASKARSSTPRARTAKSSDVAPASGDAAETAAGVGDPSPPGP
jgi:polyhydroxyalkanoate synthesis regulator phasin